MELQRHLRAAQGYLELGLFLDSQEELDHVPIQLRMRADYLLVHYQLLRKQERWEDLEEISHWLLESNPDEPELWVAHADAIRHARTLTEATGCLVEALARFPSNGHLLFQMACYRCQGGDLAGARDFLSAASQVDQLWKQLADLDGDLAPLRNGRNRSRRVIG